MSLRRFRLYVLLALLTAPFPPAQDSWHKEGDELKVLLQWEPGQTIADVGAGNGNLTLIAAEVVGPSGKVYSTEMDLDKLKSLQELSTKQLNIIPIEGSQTKTNLPDLSCDSIYMRLVYHHFTDPAKMDSSLFRSLKHRGRLAIVDEEPSKGSTIPEGVPANRGGHGIPEKILISELRRAGFEVQKIEDNWPSGDEYHKMYCVVFRKP